VDVQDAVGLDAAVEEVARQHQRLDTLVVATSAQYVSPVLEHLSEKIGEVRWLRHSRGSRIGNADLYR
jgi:hypothetical protein